MHHLTDRDQIKAEIEFLAGTSINDVDLRFRGICTSQIPEEWKHEGCVQNHSAVHSSLLPIEQKPEALCSEQ